MNEKSVEIILEKIKGCELGILSVLGQSVSVLVVNFSMVTYFLVMYKHLRPFSCLLLVK